MDVFDCAISLLDDLRLENYKLKKQLLELTRENNNLKKEIERYEEIFRGQQSGKDINE